jgi:hypothetical protein
MPEVTLHMRVGLERHDVVAIAANVNDFYQQLALASLKLSHNL